jgi:hypothetical protein
MLSKESKMKKIVFGLFVYLVTSSSLFALELIHLEAHEKQLIEKHQLNPLKLAHSRAMKNISAFEDARKGYDFAIRLNHLARNAQHIFKMHDDLLYCFDFKNRASVFNTALLPSEKNVVQGHDSRADLKKIIEVLNRASYMVNGLFSADFLVEVKNAEDETLVYRNQRELPETPGFNVYDEYHSHDFVASDDGVDSSDDPLD